MKIDCPHCGVHGSIDDSFAGKKLRCPQCSKIFLVPEEILPEVDDTSMVHQGTLYDEKPQRPETVEQESVEAEESVELGEAAEPVEEAGAEGSEELEGLSEAIKDILADANDSNLEQCSACNQSFAPELLVEVESKRYCALCQPDSEEEGFEFLDEEDSEVVPEDEAVPEDELLEIMEEDFLDEEVEEIFVEEEDDVPDLIMGDESEDDFAEEDSKFHALMGDDDDADEYFEESCSVCGEKFHRDFMQEVDSKLYCGVCQPEVIEELTGDGISEVVATEIAAAATDEENFGSGSDFSIGELIKEAWQKTKGAKASIWGATIVMFLILFGISFGGIVGFQRFYEVVDPMISMGVYGAVEVVSNWLSMLMAGGIMLIGVRRALEQRVSWKMVFAGFAKVFPITIAIILQTILILIGFVLLILPGIYLSIGYALTLPLILEKGMGPWEAMEASRKAIHKKWWSVFGLYFVMLLLFIVSAIPVGLGLIWTIPMFYVLIGVLYVRLFNSAAFIEEDMDEEFEETEDERDEEPEDIFGEIEPDR